MKMKLILTLLIVIGVAAAKPAYEFEDLDEKFDPSLMQNEEFEDLSGKPKPYKQPKPDIPLFGKFIYYLQRVSIGKVKPDEHPDRKYIIPGKEFVDELIKVRKAVLKALKPAKEIFILMVKDYKEMIKRVKNAVKQKNIAKATHIVGEYFIAINRRFVTFFITANQRGLFEEVGEDDDMKKIKRELSDENAKASAEFILKNFNQFRVNDGLLDAPFVKLGVETAKVLIRTFKQMEKVTKISVNVYIGALFISGVYFDTAAWFNGGALFISGVYFDTAAWFNGDMVSDIVHLALEKKEHDAAVRRAGEGVISMIRRETKVVIALHRIYSPKKCYGPPPKKRPQHKKGPNPKNDPADIEDYLLDYLKQGDLKA